MDTQQSQDSFETPSHPRPRVPRKLPLSAHQIAQRNVYVTVADEPLPVASSSSSKLTFVRQTGYSTTTDASSRHRYDTTTTPVTVPRRKYPLAGQIAGHNVAPSDDMFSLNKRHHRAVHHDRSTASAAAEATVSTSRLKRFEPSSDQPDFVPDSQEDEAEYDEADDSHDSDRNRPRPVTTMVQPRANLWISKPQMDRAQGTPKGRQTKLSAYLKPVTQTPSIRRTPARVATPPTTTATTTTPFSTTTTSTSSRRNYIIEDRSGRRVIDIPDDESHEYVPDSQTESANEWTPRKPPRTEHRRQSHSGQDSSPAPEHGSSPPPHPKTLRFDDPFDSPPHRQPRRVTCPKRPVNRTSGTDQDAESYRPPGWQGAGRGRLKRLVKGIKRSELRESHLQQPSSNDSDSESDDPRPQVKIGHRRVIQSDTDDDDDDDGNKNDEMLQADTLPDVRDYDDQTYKAPPGIDDACFDKPIVTRARASSSHRRPSPKDHSEHDTHGSSLESEDSETQPRTSRTRPHLFGSSSLSNLSTGEDQEETGPDEIQAPAVTTNHASSSPPPPPPSSSDESTQLVVKKKRPHIHHRNIISSLESLNTTPQPSNPPSQGVEIIKRWPSGIESQESGYLSEQFQVFDQSRRGSQHSISVASQSSVERGSHRQQQDQDTTPRPAPTTTRSNIDIELLSIPRNRPTYHVTTNPHLVNNAHQTSDPSDPPEHDDDDGDQGPSKQDSKRSLAQDDDKQQETGDSTMPATFMFDKHPIYGLVPSPHQHHRRGNLETEPLVHSSPPQPKRQQSQQETAGETILPATYSFGAHPIYGLVPSPHRPTRDAQQDTPESTKSPRIDLKHPNARLFSTPRQGVHGRHHDVFAVPVVGAPTTPIRASPSTRKLHHHMTPSSSASRHNSPAPLQTPTKHGSTSGRSLSPPSPPRSSSRTPGGSRKRTFDTYVDNTETMAVWSPYRSPSSYRYADDEGGEIKDVGANPDSGDDEAKWNAGGGGGGVFLQKAFEKTLEENADVVVHHEAEARSRIHHEQALGSSGERKRKASMHASDSTVSARGRDGAYSNSHPMASDVPHKKAKTTDEPSADFDEPLQHDDHSATPRPRPLGLNDPARLSIPPALENSAAAAARVPDKRKFSAVEAAWVGATVDEPQLDDASRKKQALVKKPYDDGLEQLTLAAYGYSKRRVARKSPRHLTRPFELNDHITSDEEDAEDGGGGGDASPTQPLIEPDPSTSLPPRRGKLEKALGPIPAPPLDPRLSRRGRQVWMQRQSTAAAGRSRDPSGHADPTKADDGDVDADEMDEDVVPSSQAYEKAMDLGIAATSATRR